MNSENVISPTFKCDELCYYAKTVLSKMNVLRENGGSLCDVILRVSGVDFAAHKVVLAASCDYFAAMFSCGLSESQMILNSGSKSTIGQSGLDNAMGSLASLTLPVIELGPPLSSPSIMQILLAYMYSGMPGVHINRDNVQELLPAAAALHLDCLKQACALFLLQQLEATNVLGIRRFSEVHHCPQLYNCAQEFVMQHFDAVCLQEEWLTLTLPEVIAIIEREDLQTQSEEQVYEAVMRWVCHDLPERTPSLPQLLRHVRMCVLSAQYLTDVVDIDPNIRRIHACRDLVDDAKRYHLRPDQRNALAAQDVRFRSRAGLVEHLVVIAGFGADQAPTDSVEIFSPETGEWCDLPSLPKRYRYVSACALGSCVYTIGGFDGRERLNTVAVLDVSAALRYYSTSSHFLVSTSTNADSSPTPSAANWRWLTPMHHRRGLAASCTYQDRIYVAGGFDGVVRLRSLEVYHPKIDEWHLLEDMNVSREGAGLVVVNDTLYALGGYNGECLLNSMECYFLSNNHQPSPNNMDYSSAPIPISDSQDPSFQAGSTSTAWRMCPSMHMRRSGAGCAVMGDCILVCGGFGGADGLSPMHLACVESYDTRFGQWTRLKNMNVPRCYVGAACLGNKIYVAAGYDGTSLLDSVEAFDSIENRWHLYPECRMRHERCDTGMCVVKLRIQRPSNSSSSHLMYSSMFRQFSNPYHHQQQIQQTNQGSHLSLSLSSSNNSITTVIGSPLWSQQQQQRYVATQQSTSTHGNISRQSINSSNITPPMANTNPRETTSPSLVMSSSTGSVPLNLTIQASPIHSLRAPEGDGGPPSVREETPEDDASSLNTRSTVNSFLHLMESDFGDVSVSVVEPREGGSPQMNVSSESSENDWAMQYRQLT